ncbi:MAG: CAP domain-containing protein [Anaerolineae bacterium]|nr:CAP domain-containing protein [Anaerolineae bacterium]
MMDIRRILSILFLVTLTAAPLLAQGGYDPAFQTAELLYQEARTVYLGNLARRDNGIPPLRWNRQLTHAARWFSWDSTENRPPGFCGHEDTLGRWPGDRALAFGYLGSAGAENAFCGYVTPEDAIAGWMASDGHRANLLDPNSREVGLGYYRRDSDGRGYVTQDFGADPAHAPVVIDNEALSTESLTTSLYIYDRSSAGGFAGLAPATEMMVSHDPCFTGAAWEPYAADREWALAGGSGWRSVYVKTRDAFGHTMTVSDTIYLGADVPPGEIGAGQMSTTQPQVTLYGLDGEGLPQAQFSLGWLADDTFGTFGLWWGNGERVQDAAAWGGTAYRLYPGAGESFAWVWDTTFIQDIPLVAYFRLKVNNNTSSHEVARVSVLGGGTEYGPLTIRGTDLAAPDQYQEFALDFTFNTNPDDPFLIFQFWRSGDADVYVDAVSIFSAPQAATSPLTWSVPGGNYRGQGVWVRYTDGTTFSPPTEAATARPALDVSPEVLDFLAPLGGPPPPTRTLTVTAQCASFDWEVSVDAPWLQAQALDCIIQVGVNLSGLITGVYSSTVTISPTGISGVPPASVPVQLTVAPSGGITRTLFLPMVARHYAQPGGCEPIPGVTYGTLDVDGPPTDRPAEVHADLNLTLRGYEPTDAFLGLIDYGGGGDPLAPQLYTLFADQRVPAFPAVYQVYDWDWACNCRGALLTDYEVTLAGMGTAPGEVLHLPDSGYNIGGGYEALVLYASEDRITLKYTCNDNVVAGYTVHVENVCVEPTLLALYQSWNDAGRGQLPALRGGQPFGRARGGEIRVAIRDYGTFMDPRSEGCWWQGHTRAPLQSRTAAPPTSPLHSDP